MDLREAKKQIYEAHKTRAISYYYLYDEMEKEFGEEKAKVIFKKAAYRRGKDIHKHYAEFIKRNDFKGLSEYFCRSSPSEGELFHPKIEKVDETSAVLTMDSCPLVLAWKEIELSHEKIKVLCEVSSAIDYGTFESDKTQLTFTHQIGRNDNQCRLLIQRIKKN